MNDKPGFKLAPLGHIGILGGGQLGRMMAIAAARLGYQCTIYCPEENCPAAQVAGSHIQAAYDDIDALTEFAAGVDIITYEFENIPLSALRAVASHKPLRPGVESLRVSGDRLVEKQFMREHEIGVTIFAPFHDMESLCTAYDEIGQRPAIAKTRNWGYDGKGQFKVRGKRDFEAALEAMGDEAAILEAVVDFDMEISALVARDEYGNVAAYPIGQNLHRDGILHTTTIPATLADHIEARARVTAAKIANALDHIGLLTVEMFVADNKLLVNEIAPRVHNSGHWTIEGALTSQFEQHIRAICGLQLGPTDALGEVVMENLLGEDINRFDEFLGMADVHYHHYGKKDPRPGRKMGHITKVKRPIAD